MHEEEEELGGQPGNDSHWTDEEKIIYWNMSTSFHIVVLLFHQQQFSLIEYKTEPYSSYSNLHSSVLNFKDSRNKQVSATKARKKGFLDLIEYSGCVSCFHDYFLLSIRCRQSKNQSPQLPPELRDGLMKMSLISGGLKQQEETPAELSLIDLESYFKPSSIWGETSERRVQSSLSRLRTRLSSTSWGVQHASYLCFQPHVCGFKKDKRLNIFI